LTSILLSPKNATRREAEMGKWQSVKKELGIALPDCIVIATAQKVGGRAVLKEWNQK
jgi:predicted benzoate:H+ symporter BenE